METVSNVAAAASRAIWGDSTKKDEPKPTVAGEEPISGELGNTKAGEPYDKGNDELSSEPKSLTKTSSKELTASDSTADLLSTSNLPSTAAHSSPLANHENSSSAYTTPMSPAHEKKPETATEITLPKDEKTDAATKAAIDQLQKQTKALSVGDTKDGSADAKGERLGHIKDGATDTKDGAADVKGETLGHTKDGATDTKDGAADVEGERLGYTKDGAADTKGDGLVSAKKVEEGEGVNTGVKSTATEGVQASKEPASVVEPAKKTVTPAAASSSTSSSAPSSSSTPSAPSSSTKAATTKPSAPRKSESSGSSEEDVETGGRKKKLSSLKEKIKAKLHKH